MNDRFLFRVWDIKRKKYVPPEDVCHAEIGLLARTTNFICEQCTGLKDKNGRLIYEGDIVKLDSEQSDIHIAKVIYRNGCFYLSAKKWVSPFNFLKPRRWKIIGNIHENPELLEVKK